MNLSSLKPAKGSIKNRKRIGRGQGSGRGGTSTRGHKGQKSRSGYKRMRGYEGGQMPLQRRVPKFGFKNINRVEYRPINLDTIQKIVDEKNIDKITIDTLLKAGFIKKSDKVKILGNGELKSSIEIEAHAFSKTAQAEIEKANGKIIKL